MCRFSCRLEKDLWFISEVRTTPSDLPIAAVTDLFAKPGLGAAMVNCAFRTSMEVGVEVTAEDPMGDTAAQNVGNAFFTFVAIDDATKRPMVLAALPPANEV